MHTTSVSPVFIGRTTELDVLTSALARAEAGAPQALVIGGEAGVGKTRLLEEFLSVAEAAQAVTALGACLEIGADGLPYASVVGALRSLHRRLGPELEQAALGHEEELARLLPDLGEVGREAAEESGRGRLFELTVDLLEKLSEHRTIVLAIEDLHWAGRSTRDLLSFLFRSVQRGRLLVVATYRADDIHRRHPLRPFLAELERLRAVERIDLPRFTRDEVERQLSGILRATPEHSFVSQVYQRSEGNAFFVEELACSIGSGCGVGISDSLRDLLLVRVEALPEEAQRVVRVAAEGGSSVEYPLLAAVAQLPEDDLIEALRAAVGASILLPTADGDGYRFRHALVREAVGDDLLPGERSRLNRRYAEALEAQPGLVRKDERVTRLASYWYYANDADKAVPAVLAAAFSARRRSAYGEQLALLERAMELWESVSEETREGLRYRDGAAEVYPPCGCYSDSEDSRLRYLDMLAEATVAARRGGSRDRAYTLPKRALRLIDATEDPLRAAWFWTQRSRAVVSLRRGDGRAELLKARALVDGLPPSAVQADVLSRFAAWEMLYQATEEGVRTAEEAVRLARQVGAREVELHARITLAVLHSHLEPAERALQELDEVIAEAKTSHDPDLLARAYTNISSVMESVGLSARSAEVARSGAAVAEQHGLARDSGAFIVGNLVEALISTGEWDEAEKQSARGRDWARAENTLGSLATHDAELALLRGDLARAEEFLERSWENLGRKYLEPQQAIPMADLVVRISRRTGRFAQARATALESIEAGFPPGTERYAWPLLFHAAQAEADSIGLPDAEPGRADVLARIHAAADGLRVTAPVWQAWAYMAEAELTRAGGHSDAALWCRAVAALEPLERPYQLATARFRQAEALVGAGDREGAQEPLSQAAQCAERLGAAHLRREIALLAERARILLGPREPRAAEPPSQDGGLGLTRRESEVLRLVAAGRSNRQIAEELFISPKTASVHVSNILAKLGVGGRGEAAALAHRLGLFVPHGTTHTASA
ncbi:helix-turn-helix transcriptional regulator [Wenjunlia tyrosinilytica]|uniref:helix-turn-helix transcriptional regulator n=1 Tax=Wenjunlia tyrosinilytica TaxID=1544741 RepID=UPI0027E4033B|nr:AAA family ATPase [Wenjunlia tyrosinilytica]